MSATTKIELTDEEANRLLEIVAQIAMYGNIEGDEALYYKLSEQVGGGS